jgi:hypothetical protein
VFLEGGGGEGGRRGRACYGSEKTVSFVGGTPMKWVSILAVAGQVFMVLWYTGYVEQFLGPWASWAKFIGYFQ